MTLQKLLEDTLALKREIESSFNARDQVKGEINYETIRFIFRILPPIKPLALSTAQRYFKIQDGNIIIEGEGVTGLARIHSDISKWLNDLKATLEAPT